MAKLSDVIEDFIKTLLDDGCKAIIQRNELANKFNCAPSQISYVLTTRFTIDRGYHVESRKGGGGYVTILKMENSALELEELLISKIRDSITYGNALNIVDDLLDKDYISKREYILIKAAICDRSLPKNINDKNCIRANILKNILLVIFS